MRARGVVESSAVVGTALIVAGAGVLALAGRPPSHVALALAAAFVPYAVLVARAPSAASALPVRATVLIALATGFVLLAAPPVLSDDLYRYLWDGRVLRHGIDPYAFAPGDPALAHLRDDLWRQVSYPEIATIYPPVAQGLFAIAGAIWHHPASLKCLALAGHLAVVPLVARLAGPPRSPGPSNSTGRRAALLYALNPLALAESALSGHVDTVAGLALIGCVAALLSNRAWLAACLAGVAAGVKLVGLALAPLVALRSGRATALAVGLAAASAAPLLFAGAGPDEAGLTHYSRRWRGNEGPFAIVEGAATMGVEGLAHLTDSPPGKLRLPFLRPVLRALEDTPFDPRATLDAEKKAVPDPADLRIDTVAGLLARLLVLAAVLGLALWCVRRRVDPLLAARGILLAVLLLSPQVHPWYLMWLLPLEVAAGRVAGLVWSAAVLTAYAPLDQWVASRIWDETAIARLVEYGLVVGVLTVEEGWRGKNGSGCAVHVG